MSVRKTNPINSLCRSIRLRSDECQAVDPVRVLVEFVVSRFVLNEQRDDEKGRHPGREVKEVYKCVTRAVSEIPESNRQKIPKHAVSAVLL